MKKIHYDHRNRLDEKVLKYGIEVLEEHELLEFMLFSVVPRADTNKLAHRLLGEFGTISSVLATEYRELLKVKGVGNRTAMYLTTLPQVFGAVERIAAYGNRAPHLTTFDDMSKYMPSFFFNRLTEVAYVFCLNAADSVVHIKRVSDGSSGKIYIHEPMVAKEAILFDAYSIVIAHNHPGGILLPSVNDVIASRSIQKNLKGLGVKFKDSIIVSGGECFSMREAGYLTDPDEEKEEEEAREFREKYRNFEPELPELPDY